MHPYVPIHFIYAPECHYSKHIPPEKTTSKNTRNRLFDNAFRNTKSIQTQSVVLNLITEQINKTNEKRDWSDMRVSHMLSRILLLLIPSWALAIA